MINIIYFEQLESTNSYLKDQLSNHLHGDCIVAGNQTNGRGQQGAVWESQPNQNLTFSLLVDWNRVNIQDQFRISKLVSIVVLSELKLMIPKADVKIKWPNDIYVNGKKIGGILIENTLLNKEVERSIIGIGLNINQTDFADFGNKKATSLKLETDKEFEPISVLKTIGDALLNEVNTGRIHDFRTLDRVYLNHLYRFKTKSLFYKNNLAFEGEILNVSPSGKLMIETYNGVESFDIKEVEFKM